MHIIISILHRHLNPTGVCRHAVNLAQCLADHERIKKITIIIGIWQKKYFENVFMLTSKKILIEVVNMPNTSVKRNLWYIFSLPKLAAKLKADIVHHAFPVPFFAELFPCPTVSTIHDLYPYEIPENFKFPNVLFNQFFFKQCIKNSHGLSCVSNVTFNTLKKHFPELTKRKMISVIYNYVDFIHVRPKIPSGVANGTDTPFILSVAQHRRNKNLHILIDSFSSLLKKSRMNPGCKLILVGSEGPETEKLKQQVQELSLSQNIILLSSLGDDELCWLYKNCEMLVVPSSTEGFCLPIVEALFFSCKVVCSDIQIFREVGFSNCTYFKLDGDAVLHLEEAMQSALEQPKDTSKPDLRFTKKNATSGYLALYDTVLESSNATAYAIP